MLALRTNNEPAERAFLVGIELPGAERWAVKDSLEELALLARTAGAEVSGNERYYNSNLIMNPYCQWRKD